MKKIAYLLITLSLIAFIIYKIDFKKSVEILNEAKRIYILMAILLGVFNSFLIEVRIKTLFSIFNTLPTIYFWALSYVGSLVSLFFPLSLGGISMGYFLSKRARVSYSKSFLVVLGDFLIAM